MGYDVIGYDPSSFYLKEAEKTALKSLRHSKNRPKFFRGDPYKPLSLLFMNNKKKYDAIIIMDNSFGYYGKSEDILMLRELYKLASPGCILIVETENRDWRLSNFEPRTFFKSDKVEMRTIWKFNFETSVSIGNSKFYKKTANKNSKLQLSLKVDIHYRLYSLHELREILERSGWAYKEAYDDIITLKPFSNSSMSIFSICIRQ
jgi:SAM-dependent methyltransferase